MGEPFASCAGSRDSLLHRRVQTVGCCTGVLHSKQCVCGRVAWSLVHITHVLGLVMTEPCGAKPEGACFLCGHAHHVSTSSRVAPLSPPVTTLADWCRVSCNAFVRFKGMHYSQLVSRSGPRQLTGPQTGSAQAGGTCKYR